jgi:DNA adenine methylase
MIPKHECYVEVFGGAAWVLFAKQPSPVEVLNDIDSELINFFRVLKHQPNELIASFAWELASREEWNRLLGLDIAGLTEVERAHRFFYLIMSSWGGELGSIRFQTSISDGGHGNRLIGALETLEQRIKPAHDRLKTVIIEHLPWEECVDRYDDERTFFYLDPPYPGNKCNYERNMRSLSDHVKLVARLKMAKSRWLLTTYDSKSMRELFAGYHFRSISFASGMAGNGYRNVELIVTNFLPQSPEASSRPEV